MTTRLGTLSRTAGAVAALTTLTTVLAAAAPTYATGATPSPAASSTSTTTGPPQLIDYSSVHRPGKTVHSSAQTKRLQGAPDDFKTFVGRLADKLEATNSCDPAAIGVTVNKLRTDGYAVGGVDECGGYAALWAEVDGHWRQIDGTQDSWECRTLHRYTVPSDIAGDSCFNYRTNKAHAYHQD